MIPVVAASHQLPDGDTTTRVASRRLHNGNVFFRGRHTDAFPRLGRRAQLYGQAGMSRSCHPLPLWVGQARSRPLADSGLAAFVHTAISTAASLMMTA